jgi:hemerythrin-like domain-containing protein
MKMTDALRGEHGVFYAIFDHLEDVLVSVESADEVRDLAAMLTSALVPHAKLENEVLFPAVEEQIGTGGPVAVMRAEHDEIEGILTGLNDSDDADELKGRILRAIRVAREHFRKEEMVLFPMADERLGDGPLRQLGMKWAAKRQVMLG